MRGFILHSLLLYTHHDALVGLVIKDIVDIRLFNAALSNGFNHANALLDEEGVHAREDLDGLRI
jgi:hypothetical protein